ncbi:MAG: FAD-dependent oxidoreductase [Gemmatimonadaceae bacterium]
MRTSLEGSRFDVLVIGGGITGAGVARDAAMRGLSVALVDKEDFASGTSSRSSRLVHGGIRYLEYAQIGMVRESVRERETLLRIAPHLVHPLEFTWPVYRKARISRTKLRLAIGVYNFLAGHPSLPRVFSGQAVLGREPRLKANELKGGAVYTDARTDDSRLTLATVLAAKAAGAITVNHAEAVRPISRDKSFWVVKVMDAALHAEFEVKATVVVNTTGPWNLNLERRWPQHKTQRRGSKGVHIALPAERVGNQGAITILSPDDERVMFVLPAGQFTIVGTTDTWTDESPDEVRPWHDDVEYLLRAANAYFPDAKLSEADIVSAWAGIRPLTDSDSARNPSEFSREHRINTTGAGMINVSGGKLTTYRAMAAEIVDTVEHELGRKPTKCTTADVDLPGAERLERIAAMLSSDPTAGGRIVADLPYTIAELRYGIESEMALTLSDLLMRRTRIAFETPDHGLACAPQVAEAVAGVASWDKYQKRAQLDAYTDDVARVFSVEP